MRKGERFEEHPAPNLPQQGQQVHHIVSVLPPSPQTFQPTHAVDECNRRVREEGIIPQVGSTVELVQVSWCPGHYEVCPAVLVSCLPTAVSPGDACGPAAAMVSPGQPLDTHPHAAQCAPRPLRTGNAGAPHGATQASQAALLSSSGFGRTGCSAFTPVKPRGLEKRGAMPSM